MIPKPFKQVTRYNDLFIPKKHRDRNHNANRDLWNQLTTINSAYPKEEIVIEHVIKHINQSYYSFDMKLSCSNKEVQKHLDEAYERHMRLPYYEKPEDFKYVEE